MEVDPHLLIVASEASCVDTEKVRQAIGRRLPKIMEISCLLCTDFTSQIHKLLWKLMRAVAIALGFQNRQRHILLFMLTFSE